MKSQKAQSVNLIITMQELIIIIGVDAVLHHNKAMLIESQVIIL